MDTINSDYGRVAATQRTRRRCWSHPETVSESCAIPSQSSQDEDEVLNGIGNLITFQFGPKQTVPHMSLTAVKSDASGIGVVGVGLGGTVALSDSREWAPPPPGKRCATVTMLLAQRIARNACWSVDEETSFSANKMNVWQTLEYLSGLSLRKKYNYEGFSDTHNVLRTLTPSWRRDSFAEKAKAEELAGGAAASAVKKYPEERSSSAPLIAVEDPGLGTSFQSSDNVAMCVRPRAKSPTGQRRKHRSRNRKRNTPHLDPEYALSPEDLQDLVKCK